MKNVSFLVIFFSFVSFGQTKFNLKTQFEEINISKLSPNDLSKLNRSRESFEVKVSGRKLVINEKIRRNVSELKIKGGVLKGLNNGEWGGKLSFISNTNRKSELLIKEGNIKFLFLFKKRIFFIEGLAHLGSSYGALFELKKARNKFYFKKVLDFDDAPEAFAIYEDKIYIASHKNFYQINDFKKKLVFQNTFWNNLYPNSLVIFDENNIFMGIRSGVVKLDVQTKKTKFFKFIK